MIIWKLRTEEQYPEEADPELRQAIDNELRGMNVNRLRLVLFIPLVVSAAGFLFQTGLWDSPTRLITDIPVVIRLMRLLLYVFLILFLGIKASRGSTVRYWVVWIWGLMILSQAYIALDMRTLLVLILELFLLNLFVFLPPLISLPMNLLILGSFTLIRLFIPGRNYAGSSLLQRAAGQFELFFTFMILIVVLTFFSIIEYRDMIREIFTRMQSEKRLETIRRQKVELEQMYEMREHVDRIIRHDLKSPLNGIIGFSNLLLLELKDEELTEMAAAIEQSGYKMLHMIESSLDMYHMEKGTYTLKNEIFDLSDVLEEIYGELGSLLRTNAIDIDSPLDAVVDDNGRILIQAERTKIANMLSNLLKNAVEASPEGGKVGVAITLGQNRDIRIEISNQGVIPEEIRPVFFTKYATAGKRHGTGLGTYSARLIARVHGGDITFTTSQSEGTCVSVHLPGCLADDSLLQELEV